MIETKIILILMLMISLFLVWSIVFKLRKREILRIIEYNECDINGNFNKPIRHIYIGMLMSLVLLYIFYRMWLYVEMLKW
jgi:hypothetical protein